MNPYDASGTPLYLITHEFYPVRGGIATFTEEIARASASLGYDVEVWAPSAPRDSEKRWPFRLRRLPLRGTHSLGSQLQLAWQLVKNRRRLRYATVYLPEPGPILTMMLLQFFHAFRPRRLVLTFHGSEILRFASSPFRRALGRLLMRRAHRISTLSVYTQELLLTHFPEAVEKAFLTPGALRSDLVMVSERPRRHTDKIIVLTVGRFHPRKGQLETLRALQMLPPEVRARLEYWIVSGQSKGRYEEQVRAAAAAVPDLAVRFLGNLPDEDLTSVYECADIFAMTSVNHGHSIEGFGLVYLEAAAHGLPVVAHDVGGVSEAVLDGRTGLLVPPERPAQLAAAFEKLIHDAELRARLGEAGRQWARRNCWKRSAAALFQADPRERPYSGEAGASGAIAAA
ncbi:MAG TPA: glycosyltransferase family 4 protein [Opitutaceae bacterium]|jgi:glycosyltransferase involved in cell wall biosynthesis|nr:glycosyltransferase family 4 protein [Opitutaceae bacterium]